MDPSGTIAALATPPGPGGVAVVRVSGALAPLIAHAISGRATLPHATLCFGRLCDPATGATLDSGYVVRFAAPRSFTGEDTAEFHVHGSPAVVECVLAACVGLGARRAGPGEFTWRAWRAGKLDLAQCEGLLDLVSARTEPARRLALDLHDGVLSRRIEALRQPLLGLVADVEARLDFAHEPGIGTLDLEAVAAAVATVRADVEGLLATAQAGRVRLNGARVVLFGAPNAGKSSLFNVLCGQDRALVHAEPGTTRDVLEALTAPDGQFVTWVDTAGLRATADPVERLGTERALAALAQADVALWVVDGTQPPPAVPAMPAVRASGEPGAVQVTVRTKADLPLHAAWLADAGPHVAVSSVTGSGLEALRAMVAGAVRALGDTAQVHGVAITRERHRDSLQRTQAALVQAGTACAAGWPPECVADDLRAALAGLGEVIGSVDVEDVLGEVFGRFCVGK
ncbi:MAG: tRNA uridine-5-carboxymethylaminomethyl(34) synthesis GTPase MnmE [Myxococcales bacterium]|nr:tRNA uridine-5-carboxymethylaminomethyl(34) synthesis GTPase MnmE [Myxococcales bacterium]